MWFFFALTFALVTSFTVIIAKRIMKDMDEYSYLWLGAIFSIPFFLAIILFFYQIPKVDGTFFLAIGLSTVLGASGGILAYRAIRISEVSLVIPMAAFNPLFTTIISFFVLAEKLSLKEILGIIIVVIGAYLLQVSKAKEGFFAPIKALATHKGVQLSLVAYFLWAITPVFEKTAIFHTSPRVPPFASMVGTLLSIIFYGFFVAKFSKKTVHFAKKYLRLFLLLGLLGGVGQTAGFTAFSLTNLGSVTAVFKLSTIFTVILGWLFFKEKNIKDRLLGSVVMLFGVFLLAS